MKKLLDVDENRVNLVGGMELLPIFMDGILTLEMAICVLKSALSCSYC